MGAGAPYLVCEGAQFHVEGLEEVDGLGPAQSGLGEGEAQGEGRGCGGGRGPGGGAGLAGVRERSAGLARLDKSRRRPIGQLDVDLARGEVGT